MLIFTENENSTVIKDRLAKIVLLSSLMNRISLGIHFVYNFNQPFPPVTDWFSVYLQLQLNTLVLGEVWQYCHPHPIKTPFQFWDVNPYQSGYVRNNLCKSVV